jgi:hypothetical protein
MCSFCTLMVGDKFRWPGGATTFLKTSRETCCVDGNPDVFCHPSPWETVVPTGEWSNLSGSEH